MNINSKMGPSTKVSGAERLDTDVVSRFGLMVLVTKGSGKTTRLMERESFGL